MSLVRRLIFPNMSKETRTDQMREILGNLKRQIPFLYAVLLINLVGLHLATRGIETVPAPHVLAIAALLAWRLFYWVFLQKPIAQISNLEGELFRIAFFTALISGVFGLWVQVLIADYGEQIFAVLLYTTLMTLGAAFGLSSFSSVAKLPLLLVGLPVAGRLLFMEDPTLVGIGVSLILALLLFMRLLYLHGQALGDLVNSRFAIDRERARAIAAETAALQKAGIDGLTGLANRDSLVTAIEVGSVRGTATRQGSVLALFDLDFFKPANDAYGHAAGDAILGEIAKRMEREFGRDALVARVGGDEFAVFWADGLSPAEIAKVGQTVCRLAADPVIWNEKPLSVTASCGIAEAGMHTTSVVEFLRQADSALYKVKTSGRGGWRIYNQELFEDDRRCKKIEGLVLTGRALDELEIHFQPIVDLTTDRIVSVEALARWDSIDLGEVTPIEFIRIAEQLGVIHEFSDVLLKRALVGAASLPKGIDLSFNLSAVEIGKAGTAERLISIVDQSGFPLERVQFEVTETAILSDIGAAREQMSKLREAGCKMALDDFGAGQTSISYLRDLNFDVVKLDGSLSSDIVECPRARRVLRGLVHLCHSVGSKCVAEHIETMEQLAHIRAMSCDMGQGYLLGSSTNPASLIEQLIGDPGDSLLVGRSSVGDVASRKAG